MIYVRMYNQNNIFKWSSKHKSTNNQYSFQLNCECAEDINKHWLYAAFDKHISYVCTAW